ncbi:MAG: tetratricopeptide repeat protein [Pyrinomonadaceae bacterium]|nr:tetratricopeptide repeat protein [Pyrinomonadaceae bacterium]
MRRSLLSLATLLCLLLSAQVSALALDKETKEVWTSVRSRNFLLVGNASEKEIRRIGSRLEQFREALTRLFGGASLQSTVPTTVIVFRSDASYRPFKPLYDGAPSNVAGFFQSSPDRNYITVTTEGSASHPFATVFHEYVHLFVESNLRGLPLCLNEGLAEYFSTLDVSEGGRKATAGGSNERHLKILRTREWLQLADLLEADNKSAIYNERPTRDLFYAESWALAHYLILGREGGVARQSDFYRFVGLMADGLSLEESFKQAFRQDTATLESELKEYIKLEKRPAVVTLFDQRTELKPEEMTGMALSEAEAKYYLGDLLLHTNRLDEAAALLSESLALNPQLAMTHASLGMVKIRQRNFPDAVPFLKRAVELAPENYLTHYYYAYGLSRQGMDENLIVSGYEETAARLMRAELMRAIELAPAYAESYHLLAFINLATGEQLEQAESLLRQAMRMAPAREEFAFVLAQIYERRRDWARAREVLEPLRRSRNPQLRIRAEQALKTISATETEMARLKASGLRIPENSSESVSALSQKPRLPKRFAGERIRGLLTNVECDANGDTVLTIKDGERVLRFHNESLRRISFVTYVQGVGRSITCGQRNPSNLILLTYRPATNPQFDGEAVGIEFVPEDLEYEP